MKNYILALVCSLLFTGIFGWIFIPLLKKIKAKQVILKYVETHKEKNGTPTMGGLFFIMPSVIVFFLFGGAKSRMATVSAVIGLAFMLVGFIDDFLKIKLKRNEGLKPYQKILFQLSIAISSGVFVYINGITVFHLPFFNKNISLGWVTIPLISLVFIAMTNCVNLSDGLDGLASSTSIAYLISSFLLIIVQLNKLEGMYLKIEEYDYINLLTVSLIGGLLGFLIFNTSKAKVFMGDTGSLSLGGFLASISIFSSNSLYIPIIGVMFVLSGISVIVQVIYYKKTKKRIFLMAPIHHHFQLKGYSETKISYCYFLVTLLLGLLSAVVYL